MTEPNRTTPPAITIPTGLKMPRPKVITLSNGIKLNVYDHGGQEIHTLIVMRNGGKSECSNPVIAGLAAELSKEGCRGKSGEEIANILEFNGSWHGSMARPHHLADKIFSLNSRADRVIGTFADMIVEPTIPDDKLQMCRSKAIALLQLNKKKVDYIAGLKATQVAIGADHPLAREEREEDLMNVTADDIRKFIANHTAAEDITLLVGGKITPALERIIADRFEQIPRRGTVNPLNIVDTHFDGSIKDIDIEFEGTVQSAVHVVMPAIKRSHPDYARLHLAVQALGGYFGSRLMSNLRESNGFTYGVSAGLHGHIDGASINISLQCSDQHAAKAIDEIRDEIARMADPSTYSADEINRIRQAALGEQLDKLDSAFNVVNYYKSKIEVGMPDDYFELQQEAINNLTPETIAEISAKYLKPEESVSITVHDKTA